MSMNSEIVSDMFWPMDLWSKRKKVANNNPINIAIQTCVDEQTYILAWFSHRRVVYTKHNHGGQYAKYAHFIHQYSLRLW